MNKRTLIDLCLACLVGFGCLATGCNEPPEQAHGCPTTWKLVAWIGSQWVAQAGSAKSAAPPTPSTTPAPFEPSAEDRALDTMAETLPQQREMLYERLKTYFDYSGNTIDAIRKVMESSSILGQGNPAVTQHPMKRSECVHIRKQAGLTDTTKPSLDPVCGKPNMVALYNVQEGQTPQQAAACIDRFEFPNIACEYPVVHATAMEAAQLCEAVGKRLCDAHEWEGACAGSLRKPDLEYAFGRGRKEMKNLHNNGREIRWAYGANKDHSLCATASAKSKNCHGGGYRHCGSNTYPSGAFPKCVSSFGVYDQHGNAAEHMNLPMDPSQLASTGKYGDTEMKGSWFIFRSYEAHDDDCRWRAPDWHATKVMSPSSHSNYHLGFRCCANVNR